MERELVSDGAECLTFIDAKNKGTSNIQNQVFSKTYIKLPSTFSFHQTKCEEKIKQLFVQE